MIILERAFQYSGRILCIKKVLRFVQMRGHILTEIYGHKNLETIPICTCSVTMLITMPDLVSQKIVWFVLFVVGATFLGRLLVSLDFWGTSLTIWWDGWDVWQDVMIKKENELGNVWLNFFLKVHRCCKCLVTWTGAYAGLDTQSLQFSMFNFVSNSITNHEFSLLWQAGECVPRAVSPCIVSMWTRYITTCMSSSLW